MTRAHAASSTKGPAGAGAKTGAPVLAFRPVKPEKTSVSVANEIKRLIFSGALRPGDRLPSEVELAERLGVSRPSVREALQGLELSGFLRVQRGGGRGRIIVDTIAESIGSSLLDAVQLSNVTTEELTAARLTIETAIVRNAAARADDADFARLRENIAAAYRHIGDGAWAPDDNIEFHKLVAAAARNRVLSLLLEALMLILTGSMSRLSMVPSAEKSREFTAAHEGILAALEGRDADVAAERMERHLVEVTARLQETG